MTKTISLALSVLSLALLQACGGGGGGGDSTSTPTALDTGADTSGAPNTPIASPNTGSVSAPFSRAASARYQLVAPNGQRFGPVDPSVQDASGAMTTLGSNVLSGSTAVKDISGDASYAMGRWTAGTVTTSSGTSTLSGTGNDVYHYLAVNLLTAFPTSGINGGSLEDSLGRSIRTAFIDTAAAQSAFVIGDMSVGDGAVLNDFTNKVAHAIAGCVAGAARTDTSGGCSAGAIGAAIGELAAEAYGRKADTTQFAAMMSAIAAAVTGANAAQINVASQAGANAAANNYVSHSPFPSVREIAAKENLRLAAICEPDCTAEKYRLNDQQVAAVERAADLAEIARRGVFTPEQAEQLAQTLIELTPVYGTGESVLQLITGQSSLTGEEVNRIWAAAGLVPIAGGMVRKVGEPAVDALTSALRAVEGPVFKTTKEATQAAEALGYKRTKETINGQAVYTDGKSFISRDVDGHNGGAWKVADSIKQLGSKDTRTGTFNADLTKKIGN